MTSHVFLRLLAGVTRRVHPRGTERLLRRLHHPDRAAGDPVRTLLRYDRGLRIAIDTGDFIEWRIFFFGHYEPAVSRFIRTSLKPGGTALDVGANVGCHALVMADAVGPTGAVYALEPHPRSFRRLRENLALNRLDCCRTAALALGDEERNAVLYGPGETRTSRGVSSLYPENVPAPREYPVTVTTLDAFCRDRELPRLDLIKIDTEGNELKIIRGGATTLSRHRPVLILEYSPRTWAAAGATLEEAAAELRELGYRLEPLPGGKGDLTGRTSADLLGRPVEKAD